MLRWKEVSEEKGMTGWTRNTRGESETPTMAGITVIVVCDLVGDSSSNTRIRICTSFCAEQRRSIMCTRL